MFAFKQKYCLRIRFNFSPFSPSGRHREMVSTGSMCLKKDTERHACNTYFSDLPKVLISMVSPLLPLKATSILGGGHSSEQPAALTRPGWILSQPLVLTISQWERRCKAGRQLARWGARQRARWEAQLSKRIDVLLKQKPALLRSQKASCRSGCLFAVCTKGGMRKCCSSLHNKATDPSSH